MPVRPPQRRIDAALRGQRHGTVSGTRAGTPLPAVRGRTALPRAIRGQGSARHQQAVARHGRRYRVESGPGQGAGSGSACRSSRPGSSRSRGPTRCAAWRASCGTTAGKERRSPSRPAIGGEAEVDSTRCAVSLLRPGEEGDRHVLLVDAAIVAYGALLDVLGARGASRPQDHRAGFARSRHRAPSPPGVAEGHQPGASPLRECLMRARKWSRRRRPC